MKTHVPGLLAAFLAGAVLASFWMMRDRLPGDLPSSSRISAPAPAGTGAAKAVAPAAAISSPGASSPAPQTSSLLPRQDPSAPGGALAQAVADILQTPEDERIYRLKMLLADLRRQGPAGATQILDYLRAGRDVKLERFFQQDYAAMAAGDTLRSAFLTTLFEIPAGNPAETAGYARKALPLIKSIQEISTIAGALDGTQLAAMNKDLESAAHRLLLTNDETSTYRFAELADKLRSETLVRDIFGAAQGNAWVFSGSLLNTAWHLPEDVRLDLSRQLINDQRLRAHLRDNPGLYTPLDMRLPEFREAIVDAFRGSTSPEQRRSLLRDYVQNAAGERQAFVSAAAGDSPPPAGLPGSPEQAAARLKLLEALAPYCDTVELQFHLANARAALSAQLSAP